jgi:hypothetical protein
MLGGLHESNEFVHLALRIVGKLLGGGVAVVEQGHETQSKHQEEGEPK